MFQIYAGESVNIESLIPERRPTSDCAVQTEQSQNESIGNQVPERTNKQIQAERSEMKRVSSVEFDPEALQAFLNRVTPEICEYLESNNMYDPFYRYKLLSDTDSTSTTILHTLQSKPEKFFCTDLSWNSNGSSLAAAYKHQYHTTWCEHDAFIAIWNPQRKDFNPQKANSMIETDNCMTRVSFHPECPALLAGAKFNGQIFIWNIAKEDDILVASSKSTLYAHREPITGLFWSTETKNMLISCSLDGKILLWQFHEKQGKLELKDGFIVLAENLARNLGIKSAQPDAEVGITCMSINCEDSSIFVISTEGGGVFQCSFQTRVPVPLLEVNSIPLKSPITVSYEKHKGHVNTVQFSPFLRNIFLSSSNDGEIRVYNILQAKPILRIHLVVGIEKLQWSLSRPTVMAAVTSDGQLQILNLMTSKTSPVEVFPLPEEKNEGTTVLFSTQNPNLLCTALSSGVIQVWMLANTFVTMDCYEMEHLKEFTLVK